MRKKRKSFGVHASSRKPTKKVCNENETKKKWCMCKNVIEGRKPFITSIQESGENDLHELQVNDYG